MARTWRRTGVDVRVRRGGATGWAQDYMARRVGAERAGAGLLPKVELSLSTAKERPTCVGELKPVLTPRPESLTEALTLRQHLVSDESNMPGKLLTATILSR